jgi:hypothetical protein
MCKATGESRVCTTSPRNVEVRNGWSYPSTALYEYFIPREERLRSEWHFAIGLAKGEVEAGDTSNAQQSRMPLI